MKRMMGLVLAVLLMGCASASALERGDWLSMDQYYYQQLSDEHKKAWEKDITNALSYPEQKKRNKDRRQQALAKMIMADNPRIFWIDWIDSNAMLRYDTGSTPHYEGVKMPQGMTLAQAQSLFAQGVDAAVKEIKAKLPKKADAKAKVKAIYNCCAKITPITMIRPANTRRTAIPLPLRIWLPTPLTAPSSRGMTLNRYARAMPAHSRCCAMSWA